MGSREPVLAPVTSNIASPAPEHHMDEFEHYNFDQDKHVNMGFGGKQRSKREAELNTNRPNPGGHERKILTKLMNAEKNSQAAASRDKSWWAAKSLFVNSNIFL